MTTRMPSFRFSHGHTQPQPDGVFKFERRPEKGGGDGLVLTVPETPAPPARRHVPEDERVHGRYIVIDTARGFWRVHVDGTVIDESGALVGLTAAEARRIQSRERKNRERQVIRAAKLAEDLLDRPLTGREYRQIRDTTGTFWEEVELIAGSLTNAQRSSLGSTQ